MLSLRSRIFILISILVLIVLGISLVLSIASKKKAETAPAPGTAPEGAAPQVIEQGNFAPGSISSPVVTPPTGLTVKPATPAEVIQNGVKQLAKIFMERYGTYSTENNFQNIREVADLVTPALWTKISARLDSKPSSEFLGVTTNVVGAEILSWQESEAVVSLKLVRTEDKSGAVTAVQQTATITLIKAGEKWLVDKFTIENQAR